MEPTKERESPGMVELKAEPVQELARSENTDPSSDSLWKICPHAVFAMTFSQQAGQIPSMGRGALWFSLQLV